MVGELEDGIAYTATTAPTDQRKVILSRSITHNNWQALYVPFTAPYSAWSGYGQVARLSQAMTVDGNNVLVWEMLGENDNVEAGTPYIFQPTEENCSTLVFNNVDIAPCTEEHPTTVYLNGDEDSPIQLLGTYASIPLESDANYDYYALNGGDFWRAVPTGSKTTLNPFRIYLKVPHPAVGSPSPSFSNQVTGGEVGITDLQPDQPQRPVDSNWYDLLGRRIAHPQPGQVYIHQGKKVRLTKN